MYIRQFYKERIAEASYYIDCNGEAAVIDPTRDVEQYIALAAKRKTAIRYIFETHFHADFISGHLDLAAATGAAIVFGPTATPAFTAKVAPDGSRFPLGDHTLQLLHTPGHSLESVCYLLHDATGRAKAVFTGDTLLIDGVGRADLVKEIRAELTPDFLAGLLYDSIQNKLAPLADDVMVYPGHGKGSLCGNQIGSAVPDSMGHQRISNFALRPGLTREQFIAQCKRNTDCIPPYFPFNMLANASGTITPAGQAVDNGIRSLEPEQFAWIMHHDDAWIVDTRPAEEYNRCHIRGSLHIPFDEHFHLQAGNLLPDTRRPLLLVNRPQQALAVVKQLLVIGYQQLAGCLRGGIASWEQAGMPLQYATQSQKAGNSEK